LVGIIVGKSIGNVNLLDVDALSVRAEHLSAAMIRTAHRDGRQVMVWGMNGEPQIRRQLSRGVDNLITSDPELALQLRDEWQDATDHERLVMAAKLLLGVGR
jgi:glycerophosphoryl diester phosphodiesterase